MIWLMKTGDDEYVAWDTTIGERVRWAMHRGEAVFVHGEERVEWVDKHLCSCRARLGETVVKRNGRMVAIGGGRLAYHFDSYAAVRRFMRPYSEREAESLGDG